MFEGFNLADGPYINHVFDTEVNLNNPPGTGNFAFPIDEVKYDYLNIGSGPGHQPPNGYFRLRYPSNSSGSVAGDINGLWPLWNVDQYTLPYYADEVLEFDIDWNWQTNPTSNDPPTQQQLYDFLYRYTNSYCFIEAVPGNEKFASAINGHVKFFQDKKVSREDPTTEQSNLIGGVACHNSIMGASIIDGQLVFNDKIWPITAASINDAATNIGSFNPGEAITFSLANGDVAISVFFVQSFSCEPTQDIENATITGFQYNVIYYIYNNPMTKLQSTLYSNGRGMGTSFTCKSSGENFLKRFEITVTGIDQNQSIIYNEYSDQSDTIIRSPIVYENLLDEIGQGSFTFNGLFLGRGIPDSPVENYPLVSKFAVAQGVSVDQAWSVGTIKAI
jgi:galactitol-specific phosphotransferase system IIB component